MLITGKIKTVCLRYALKRGETAKIHITGKNLAGEIRHGYLKKGEREVFSEGDVRYNMTDWFEVEESGKFLVMSGDAYNRAIWQFACADGTILAAVRTGKKFRVANGKVSNLTFPKVRIPAGAVRARVFYANVADGETLPPGNRLQIEYGMFPTFYEEGRREAFALPAFKKGRQLIYAGGVWYMAKQPVQETEDVGALLRKWSTKKYAFGAKIGCGDMVAVQLYGANGQLLENAKVQMQVLYEKPASAKEGRDPKENPAPDFDIGNSGKVCAPEYGVRIYFKDAVPVCERSGDAVGLHFSCKFGEEDASPYGNDFDRIYPWSALRRCAVSFVDGEQKIIYEGEAGYRTDGTAGEVMVEIPKHYAARRVTEEYEEILISPEKKEGFVLDPAFLTPSGEAEAVYVGAYFAAEEFIGAAEGGQMQNQPAPPQDTDGLMLVSRAGRQVSLYRSGEEFLAMAERNCGFAELDLCTMLMLQRLFLVESALLDSQSVFGGNTYMPFLIWDRKATYYSSEDVPGTNSIRMRNNSISKRYRVGDAVAVMDTWSTFFARECGNMMRVVTERTMDEDGMVRLTFSGAPIDLVANSTGMSELPEHTGSTDGLPGTVGSGETPETQCAHDAFCYRGIENLWGGIWVVLCGCAVKDNRLRVDYPDGRSVQISYELPEQNVNLSSKQFGAPERMYVKRMGYDPGNPLIALPCEIGGGADNCSYYCDAWFNEAKPGKEYIVTYGGAWDNMAYAGLFAFRASFAADKRITFNGARLMCREGNPRNFKSEV